MRNETAEKTRLSLQTTLDEHRGCMQVVAALEDLLARRPDPPDAWLADLIVLLGTLRTTLAEHFESEQDGALFQEVPVKKPDLADQVDRLGVEHTAMLETLDALAERCTAVREPETHHLRELNGHAQLLISTIRRHEAEENEIIMNAYWSETGGGD